MTQHLQNKIRSLSEKIDTLKREQEKLHAMLEKKIMAMLHKHNAFAHDFEALLSGMTFVLTTLNNSDDASHKIIASWKTPSQKNTIAA